MYFCIILVIFVPNMHACDIISIKKLWVLQSGNFKYKCIWSCHNRTEGMDLGCISMFSFLAHGRLPESRIRKRLFSGWSQHQYRQKVHYKCIYNIICLAVSNFICTLPDEIHFCYKSYN